MEEQQRLGDTDEAARIPYTADAFILRILIYEIHAQ